MQLRTDVYKTRELYDFARMQERLDFIILDIIHIKKDLYDKDGIFDRIRLNENKLTKILAVASALITAVGVVAILLPLLRKWGNG